MIEFIQRHAPVIRVPLPNGIMGMACVFFIIIVPSADEANYLRLLDHERIHIGQQWSSGILPFLLRYAFSKEARLDYEAEAYANDVVVHGMEYEDALYWLQRTCGLHVEECRDALDMSITWMGE